MRYELKSIGIWAFIKVSFFINVIFGFVFGLFFAVVLVPVARRFESGFGVGDAPEVMPSIGMLAIVVPIAFALFGAVFHTVLGLVLAAAYNGVAKLLGGLEFELGPVTDTAFAPRPSVAPVAAIAPETPPAAAGTVPPPPPAFRPTPPVSVVAQAAPQEEIRPETLSETPPAPQEPDEDGPRQDES